MTIVSESDIELVQKIEEKTSELFHSKSFFLICLIQPKLAQTQIEKQMEELELSDSLVFKNINEVTAARHTAMMVLFIIIIIILSFCFRCAGD